MTANKRTANKIKIGVPIPLTGVYGTEAQEQAICSQMAVDEFNESGGLDGRLAELLIRDTKQDSNLARETGIELIEKDKVDMVAGALSALDMIILGKVCTDRKVVYNGLSVGDGVVAKANRSKYIFHEGAPAYGTADTMARFAFSHYGFKVATLCVNHPFGLDSLKGMTNVGHQIGVDFVANELHPFSETNYKPFLERILKKEPEVLMTVNFGQDQFHMLNDIMSLKVKDATQLICVYLSIPQRLRMGAEPFRGIVGTTGYYWRLQQIYESSRKYNQGFMKRTQGVPPAAHGTYAYCAVKALLDAVRISNSTRSEDIIWAMESLRYDYARGPQFYRHLDHQAVQPVVVVRCKEENEMESPHDVFDIIENVEFLGPRAYHISQEVS